MTVLDKGQLNGCCVVSCHQPGL